jgi:hypothetical protein
LVADVKDALVAGGGPDGATVNVWETSHLGGHRFAPTALMMPSGTCWAFLDAPTAEMIVRQVGDVRVPLRSYRGCVGLETRRVQALERVAFAESGWGWLRTRRSGGESPDGQVTLESVDPRGERTTWAGLVVEGRQLAAASCSTPIVEADAEPELVVAAWRRW